MKTNKHKSAENKKGYNPTKAMLADTYDERTLAEMQETLMATVYAETFPDALDYTVPDEREE